MPSLEAADTVHMLSNASLKAVELHRRFWGKPLGNKVGKKCGSKKVHL